MGGFQGKNKKILNDKEMHGGKFANFFLFKPGGKEE